VNEVCTIVFPHQLFDRHPALAPGRPVWLIEDPLYFSQYRFHLQKLVFHRASMRTYAERLSKAGHEVVYVAHDSPHAGTESLFRHLTAAGIREVHLCDTTDYLLERRLERYSRTSEIKLVRYENPNFLCDTGHLESHFNGKKRFFLTEFYIAERKRLDILLLKGEPVGGKWTYDTENRKKMPSGTVVPALPVTSNSMHVKEALQSIRKEFPKNPGALDEFIYPVDTASSEKWLDAFLEKRFRNYGDYQDAIVREQAFLFHSILTPMLNVGLLDPRQVIEKALEAATEFGVPLNALEGFIRQVVGWREFIRAVYHFRGVGQRTRNFWEHKRKIPAAFYDATTGIPPVDDAIRKTLRYGYTHHIERLMVLGNFMLLCEFDPDDVYRWFMELFIDAYDWVMVPNVYGMSQYADGGVMSTKPYISGSNYLLKMSDYKKGDWCTTWDALYWRFVAGHKEFFLKNPRMSMMVRQAEKMEKSRFGFLMDCAESYLDNL
jgi:deoxyribodipyrimidine photolyase-related protein